MGEEAEEDMTHEKWKVLAGWLMQEKQQAHLRQAAQEMERLLQREQKLAEGPQKAQTSIWGQKPCRNQEERHVIHQQHKGIDVNQIAHGRKYTLSQWKDEGTDNRDGGHCSQ